MAIDYESLGKRIANARKQTGITQEALGEQLNMTRKHISVIETAINRPSLDTLVDIANALNVSADDLLVDSLTHSASTANSEIHRLLLDCNAIEQLFGGRRGPGILLAYLALFGTVAALVGLVVPQLVQSVGSFAAALPGYLENAQALLELVQANYGVDTTSLSELLLNSGSSVESFLSGLAPQLAQAAMGAAGQVVNGFLALAASVYLLCGKAELLHTARLALRTALPPRTAGNVLGVFAMANKTFSGYIGGQLVDAVLVGGETFVLMLLFGIPYAPLISVVVAVTNIVPMLGPYLGAVPGAALLLFSGQPVHALEFLVIVLVVQQVDGNFIAPRILGSATGISGLWVLAAIVVGGGLFGIPGMVIGVPVLGVAANLAKAALPREPDGEKTKPGGET